MNNNILHDNPVAALIDRFESIPSLNRDEEFELARRFIEKGDIEAAQSLANANLKNVVYIALEYAGYKLPIEDIFQEGAMGLIRAINKFDPYRGYRLMTYAAWWIKAGINDYILRFFSPVKIGTTKLQKRLFYKLNQVLSEESVADESISDQSYALSTRFNTSPQHIEEIILRLAGSCFSLDCPITPSSETSFMDILADTRSNPEDQIIESQRASFMKDKIDSALTKLTLREQDIMQQRLMTDNPKTLMDLGQKYTISKERVRQIENSVKEKFKNALEENIDLMMP
jgi:RNA polymerase sigma-32 factor